MSRWRDQYKVHPVADVFPMISRAELEKLALDIVTRGLLEPVEFVQASIVDGRNRLEAWELAVDQDKLALVGVYSNPNRDPRGHTVSVAYTVKLHYVQEPHAGSDALSADWRSDWNKETLGFEHAKMLADARKPRQ